MLQGKPMLQTSYAQARVIPKEKMPCTVFGDECCCLAMLAMFALPLLVIGIMSMRRKHTRRAETND